MAKEKVTLTGAQETLLATLYARALDSRAPDSVLKDAAADDAVERIDYDFSSTGVEGTRAVGIVSRAKVLDTWTSAFLSDHPSATVLHLACGLDTRVQRIHPAATVRWYDVDVPEVMELRGRLLTRPGGDYHEIGSSVTELPWLSSVPADRPTVVVLEGLTMDLTKHDGEGLIRRLVERFPSGQLLFDVYSRLGVKLQGLVPAVRNAGATLRWGVDDPHEIELLGRRLTCLDALRSVDMPGLDALPLSGRISLAVSARVPRLRDMGRVMRFAF